MSTATVVATTIAMTPGQNHPPRVPERAACGARRERDAVVAVAAQQDVDGVDGDERSEHGDAELERRVQRVEEARREEERTSAASRGRDDARDRRRCDARHPEPERPARRGRCEYATSTLFVMLPSTIDREEDRREPGGHDLADRELRVGHVDRGAGDDAERADEHGGTNPPSAVHQATARFETCPAAGSGRSRRRCPTTAGRRRRSRSRAAASPSGRRPAWRAGCVREVGGAEHEHGRARRTPRRARRRSTGASFRMVAWP